MKKQTHTELLETEIRNAQTDYEGCQASVERQNTEIRQAVMNGQPEAEIDALQTARDATTRQAERLRLKVEALEGKRPEAAKKDAEAALPGLVKGMTDRLAHLQDAYTGLEKAWGTVLEAVATCEKAQAGCEQILEEHGKVALLAIENELTPPESPALPIFAQDVVRQAHYEQARAIAYWQPTKGTWTKRAKEQQALNAEIAAFEREKTQRQAA